MMPHHGRNFEEEMSRFEAEINVARAQAFLHAAGGGVPPQVATVAVTSAPPNPNFSRPAVISAPPSNAVISAPPSSAVISAPPKRSKDDEDILATLEKYEKEVKSETKMVRITVLSLDLILSNQVIDILTYLQLCFNY